MAADCEEIHTYADDLWSFSDLHRLDDFIPANLRERQFTVYGLARRAAAGGLATASTAGVLKEAIDDGWITGTCGPKGG